MSNDSVDLKEYVPKLKKQVSSETYRQTHFDVDDERQEQKTFHLSIRKYCKNLPTSTISPICIKGKRCRLYITDRIGASNLKNLKTLGVTHAVDLSDGSEHHSSSDIEYMRISEHILDKPEYPIVEKIGRKAVDFISHVLAKKLENVVVVYCTMGISRSATVTLQYLMDRGMSLKESWKLLKSSRPFVNPNLGFWEQLSELEKRTTGNKTMTTRDYVIAELLEFWPSIGLDFANIVADRVLDVPFEDMITGTFLDAAVKSLRMFNTRKK